MDRMSPHLGKDCWYHFDGTGTRLQYNDAVSFRHDLDCGGNATVYFSGSVWFRGPKPS